jgi:hypothetical protein
VKWLHKMHIWVGLWGAVLGLLFGSTGILLNHRSVLPIATAVQESTVQLPLPDPGAAHAGRHGRLAQAQPQARARTVEREGRSRAARGLGRPHLVQPARWSASFTTPGASVRADYWVGNSYVTVERSDNGVLATLANLHKGSGMGVAWVLLVDTLAGSIILLSLSGVLLWALTARRRTVGIVIGAVSLLMAGGLALAGSRVFGIM